MVSPFVSNGEATASAAFIRGTYTPNAGPAHRALIIGGGVF
jgi:hypothetical protein